LPFGFFSSIRLNARRVSDPSTAPASDSEATASTDEWGSQGPFPGAFHPRPGAVQEEMIPSHCHLTLHEKRFYFFGSVLKLGTVPVGEKVYG